MELILKYFPNLSETQRMQFAALYDLYLDWNSKINVISRKDITNLYEHHVLHSLGIAKYTQFAPGTTIMDLGTGGGFPGIPLAILFPEAAFTLCDSIGKKIKVVEAVANSLDLKNVTPVWSRAEQLPGEFDYIVSRAVTELQQFMPFVKGKWKNAILYLKGGDLEQEISDCVRTRGLQRNQFVCRDISQYFSEPFFEGKKIVIIKN